MALHVPILFISLCIYCSRGYRKSEAIFFCLFLSMSKPLPICGKISKETFGQQKENNSFDLDVEGKTLKCINTNMKCVSQYQYRIKSIMMKKILANSFLLLPIFNAVNSFFFICVFFFQSVISNISNCYSYLCFSFFSR